MAEKLPFGSTIWANEPEPPSPNVQVYLYGKKVARLWVGNTEHLDVVVGNHTVLTGPVRVWEELAGVVNEALAQHRAYLAQLARLEAPPAVEPEPSVAEDDQ